MSLSLKSILINTKSSFQEVFSKKSYLLITLIASTIFYSLNTLIYNFSLIKNRFSFKLVVDLWRAPFFTFPFSGLFSLLLMSLLGGIVFSLFIYLIKRQLEWDNSTGIVGMFVAIFLPACSSCALGLFGLLSIGSFLTYLPFKGQEIGFIGIIIIFGSILYLCQKIAAKTCLQAKSNH